QHDTFLGTIEAIDRAHRHARRVGAVHARDRDRALAGHAVVDRDHAAAIHAPGDVVLLLARRDAAVALDAALGIAETFHSGHGLFAPRLGRGLLDLAQGRLGFLHHRHRVVTVGGRGIDRLAADDRRGAFGIELEQVLALPPSREVERDERRAAPDAIGHLRLDLDLRAGRGLHPDVLAVLDVAVVRVRRVDLDEVLLLQLGEPAVAARLVAATFVFDEAAAGEDQREILRDVVLDVLLLHRLVERRQPPERGLVGVRRVLRDEIWSRRIQGLAVLRNAVGEIPYDRARLRVTE